MIRTRWRHCVAVAVASAFIEAPSASAQLHRILNPTIENGRINRGIVRVDLLTGTEVQSARASIETVAVDLVRSFPEESEAMWSGVLALGALPEGVHKLVWTLTTADGSTLSGSILIHYKCSARLVHRGSQRGGYGQPDDHHRCHMR